MRRESFGRGLRRGTHPKMGMVSQVFPESFLKVTGPSKARAAKLIQLLVDRSIRTRYSANQAVHLVVLGFDTTTYSGLSGKCGVLSIFTKSEESSTFGSHLSNLMCSLRLMMRPRMGLVKLFIFRGGVDT